MNDAQFARHAITLKPGARFRVPETEYDVGVPDDGVTTSSFDDGGVTRSVVSCRLEVHENGTRVHTELVVAGETAWFRDLEVRVSLTSKESGVELEVVRAPYTSVPPKPAG